MSLGKKKVVVEVDYRDLERLVVDKYPFMNGYSFVATEECGNDSTHRFVVDGNLDKVYEAEWEKVKEPNVWFDLSNGFILNKLAADGNIEPGEYVVRVFW